MISKDTYKWTPRVFLVTRRRVTAGLKTVRPRRVCVLSPWSEASLAGVGLQRDEVATEVAATVVDHAVAWRRISRLELADFFQCFGCALRAGQSMLSAFSLAARQARCPRMRGVIGGLSQSIAQGWELHQALARFPGVFSPPMISLAQAAAKAGLDEAGALLIDLAGSLQRDGKLGRKLSGALAYPVTLLVMALVAAVILELKALPPMVELFRSMGAKLPTMTEVFYRFSRFLNEQALWLAPLGMGFIAGFAWLAASCPRRPAFQSLLIRCWLIGPIVRARSLSRALGIFLLLKQSGATTKDMFLLAAEASGNVVVADYFKDSYRRVSLGETLEEAFLAERHLLGDDGVRLAGRMDVGMAGGDLRYLLRTFVDELNEQAELRLALLPKALELPMLVLCGLIIGSIILAIFLPYPTLLGDAARQMRS